MSVRVALLERSARGGLLRSLRLVGAAADQAWSPSGLKHESDQTREHFEHAAAWIKTQLEGPRSRDALELIVLDPSGGVCTWLHSASVDPARLASDARMGPASDDDAGLGAGPGAAGFGGAGSTLNPVEFYAGSAMESSVQALGVDGTRARRRPQPASEARRVAMMATTDVPARVLIDALDDAGIRVGSVATFWHALAMAWSPGAGAGATRVLPSDPLTQAPIQTGVGAIVLVDRTGRLTWCWSDKEQLLCSGTLRCTMVRAGTGAAASSSADTASTPGAGGDDTELLVALGKDDVARLAAEWLSWSVQTHSSPVRIVCVLPRNMAAAGDGESTAPGGAGPLSPGAFGEALATAWPGAHVDAVVHEDPVGATLQRLVGFLEATPAESSANSRTALVNLSNRVGRQQRAMYLWLAAGLGLAALAAGMLGYRVRQQAGTAEAAATAWRDGWQSVVQDVYPPALVPRPTLTALDELSDEVKRRSSLVRGPAKVERARPILAELEAISLVLGVPSVKLESVFLDSTAGPQRLIAEVATTSEAEAVLESLRRVGGSSLTDWTQDIAQIPNSDARRVTYTARWPAKTSAPRAGGSGGGGGS